MKGGVTSRRAFGRLSRADQRHFPSDLEVRDLQRSGEARSFRQAFIVVYRHPPRGEDYRRVERNLGSAYEHRRGRVYVRRVDRLWVSDEPMPVPTPDGIYDAVPHGMSSRQRSVIGEYWSLVGRSRSLSDTELDRELRRFRRETFRVIDPVTGRVVRKGFITDVEGFRAFARSPEGRLTDRVISPRITASSIGGDR